MLHIAKTTTFEEEIALRDKCIDYIYFCVKLKKSNCIDTTLYLAISFGQSLIIIVHRSYKLVKHNFLYLEKYGISF